MAAVQGGKEALENAGGLVDKYLVSDQRYYDLSGLLRVTSDRVTNGSGQSDMDYPCLSSLFPSLDVMPMLGDVDHTPLPSELIQEFENMQCNSSMGLMPVIKRAWLTIDNTIYLWNYEDGKDLAYFDGLKEVILAVGLIVPKLGVFQDHIRYLLCLATPTEIVILGVSFNETSTDPYNELHLLPEPLFCLPSDNVSMTSVLGTCTGRIFLAGKDGCLYEVVYHSKDGWFRKRCYKLNHSTSYISYIVPSFFSFSDEDPLVQLVEDSSRSILYSRSQKGTIQVYDLSTDGMGLSYIASMSLDTIVRRCCHTLRIADKSLFNSIVHLSLIPLAESFTLHLLAITKAGVRLYFTTTPQGKTQRPSLLSLVHVRLPPGYCPSNAASKPGPTVHQGFYRRGCLLLASSQADDRDMIWLVDPDLYPFQSNLVEASVTYPLNGRTWCMAESIEPGELEAVQSLTTLPPAVVSQHTYPPRRFILLTTNGSYIITKPRPVDQLQFILEQTRSGQGRVVEEFFHLHGNTQASAMCLILATRPNREVAHWATEAYFKHGGEPHFIFPTTLGPNGVGPSPLSSFQQQTSSPFHPPVQTPPLSMGGALGRPMIGPEVQLSGKHDGLILYLSRLLRPLWNVAVAMETQVAGSNDSKVVSHYDVAQLGILGEQLRELKSFLDANIQFFTADDIKNQRLSSPANIHQRMLHFMRPEGMATDSPDNVQQSLLNKYRSDAYLLERTSLQSIHYLIGQVCEALSLWRLLCEYQFDLIANGLDNDKKQLLKMSTFKFLVTGGKELPSSLINSLLARHSGDSSITDNLMLHLRQLSPSLFSQEDAVASKAQEYVTMAAITEVPSEKRNLLRESLKLYSQVTDQISLSSVCQQYKSQRYYEGIVELSISSASSLDSRNLAQHFYKAGQPPINTHGQEALSKRCMSYEVVTKTLGDLYQESQQVSVSPSVPIKPGPPAPATTPQRIDPMEEFDTLIRYCLRADDELFHVSLYSWLLNHPDINMRERLIQIQSPFIEDFLKYTSKLQQDNTPLLNILWRYYERNKNYIEAARILDQLAKKENVDLNLDRRLEYISRAVMCAKSCGSASGVSGEGEFLHELEERMEVARIQLSILQGIQCLHHSQHTENAMSELNSKLMDVSELYGDYADPFNLSECKLAIVHCAGHFDVTLIESLWNEIIEQELQSTLGNDRDTRMHSMREKLLRLGRLYSRSDSYFPTAYLIKLLEQHSCQLGWDPGFIPDIFHQVGVSYSTLFTLYNNLFEEKDTFWGSVGRPLHVLSVLLALLSAYTANSSLVATKHFSVAIDRYLVELQTLDPSTPDINTVTAGLRNLKRELQRNLDTSK